MFFFRKSLVGRLVASFFIFSMMMIVVISLIAHVRSQDALIDSVFARLEVAVTHKENELNRWINDQKQEIIYLAKSPEIRDKAALLLGRERTHRYFRSAYSSLSENLTAFTKRNPYFREILILSQDGGEVVFSTKPKHEKTYHLHDRYFKEGLKTTYVENVYPSPETTEPILTVATPLVNEKAERTGVLAVHFNLDWMDRLLFENSGLGRTGETYLVDKYNDFVSGVRFGRDDFPRGVHTFGIDAAVSGQSGQARYDNYRGEAVFGYFRWLEQRDLALLAEINEDEALASAQALGWTIGFAGLGISAFLAVGIYLIARQIARPVLAIAGTSTRIAEGDLDIEVPVQTEDEVGTLGRSLNQMVQQLRSLYLTTASNEEKYRLLIENQTDLVVKVDREGRLLFVSPSYCRTFGKTEDELLGKTFLPMVHPEDQDETSSQMEKLFRPPYTCYIEQRALTADGWRWLAWVDTAVIDETGEVGEIIGVGRDVTDRKTAEIELEKYQKYLEHIVEERTAQLQETQHELVQKERLAALGQLAATVSHEIRNPLGTIRNAVSMLDESCDEVKERHLKQALELTQRNIDRCDRIINEMLDFTRQRELIYESFEFDAWIETILSEIDVPADVLVEKKLNCPGQVTIDSELMRRVIINIMNNAFQAFMNYQAGRKTVTVVTHEENGWINVSIIDNGPGISTPNLERIFEPLFSTKGFGVGLGMAIVKNIIEDHGGEIHVSSLPGEGATIALRIPKNPRGTVNG